MQGFFTNTDVVDCPIETFSLFDDNALTNPVSDAAVTHDSTKLQIDQGSVGSGLFYGNFITKGLESQIINFEYHVCRSDSLSLTYSGQVDEVFQIN
jgi:hypothetical protein